MKLLFSAFTGYNLRELLLPISPLLNRDQEVSDVIVVTPADQHHDQLMPDLKDKYQFISQQDNQEDYQNMLARYQPQIVVTPTAGLEPRDIPLINAAKHLGIPTLTFVASWDNVYKMERRIKITKYQQQYALADHFAVWNKINLVHLLDIIPALNTEHITIVGAPRFDFFNHLEKIPTRKELFNYLGFTESDGKLIHFATTELYPMDYVVKTITAASKQRAIHHKLNFYASVHPGGYIKKHQRYSRQHNVVTRYSFGRRNNSPQPDFQYSPTLQDTYMLNALFKHADLLVNHSSTVAIESLAGDTPVINVKYGRRLDWWNWHRSMVYRDFKQHYRYITDEHATAVVHNPRQLIKAVNEYLSNPLQDQPARQQTLAKMITYTDGTSGQRLLDLIKRLAIGHT
jgi:hypothetical protein